MKTVTVNAKALRDLLAAIIGPGHLIRELQTTRGQQDNPINLLIAEYNAATEKFNSEKEGSPT